MLATFSKKTLAELPAKPGVYCFKNSAGRVLYIGKSTNIATRVRSHFASKSPKIRKMLEKAKSVDWIEVSCELEALLLEAKLIKKYQPPFNSVAKDDKHPLYIKITKEKFPRIFTSRREDEKKAIYFGPFPSSSTVRQVLRQIRKIFPYCSQKGMYTKACFYSHLGLCNPCPGTINKIKNPKVKKELSERYRKNINNIVLLLSGRRKTLQNNLTREMKRLAKEEKFEDAAFIRDTLKKLEYITQPYTSVSSYLENPKLVEDIRQEELTELTRILQKYNSSLEHLERIEALDVAHIAGASAACCLVTFINGEPEKNLYRRFKIKKADTLDDFAMLREAVGRRLRYLKDWGVPDLLLIDGGKGQVSSVQDVLRANKVKIPVIGLAKRREEIVIPLSLPKDELGYKFVVLRLGRANKATQLLQRIRDEAHRFARAYHFKLRMKELLTAD